MSSRICVTCLVACLLLAQAGLAFGEDTGRSMPFNKQNVFNYFQRVESAKRELPEKISPEEYQNRVCSLYASILRQGGYDFEHTVENALQFAEKGNRKLDDPRFLFLAGVFQVHPDAYLRLKLISKATRDAVLHYFGG